MVSPRGLRILAACIAVAVPVALVGLPALAAAPSPSNSPKGAQTGSDPYLSPQGNGGYDVTNYDVTLSFDKATHGIAAATVIITATADQALRQFSLDARSGLSIADVRVDGRRADFSHRHDKLVVNSFGVIDKGGRFRVQVRYSGDPIPVDDVSGRGQFGWLHTRNGSVTYTEPTGTSTWLPSNDIFYDKATWQVSLSAPKGLFGVSTGAFLGRQDKGGRTLSQWRIDTPIQPYAQVVAFDKFDYSREPIAGLPAFTAVAKGSGVTVGQIRKRTDHALRWLVPKLGRYPFQSTGGIVVNGADSAMETAGRPTYSSGSYNTSTATVLHEQAHQWFGNTLTATNARDIWLHEGFATYLENVETAQRTGRPIGDIVHEQYVWDGWGAKWRGQFGRVSLHEPTTRYLLNTTPYYRGQAALHALRRAIGDDAFWDVLRALADEPVGRTSTTAEVIAEAETVSGLDLAAWADTWVYSVGAQQLPEAPTQRSVIDQVGPYILDAAGDYVWDPRGNVLRQLRKAHKSWQPLDQLTITKVSTMKHGRNTRYFADFETTVGVIYPAPYKSCFVFDRGNAEILSGSLIGVRHSDSFQPNHFTPAPCERVWN